MLKVPPISIDGEDYKVASIDLAKKTKIMNALIETGGKPSFDVFVNVLQFCGFKDDDILMMDIETTTAIANAIIGACNTKKKKKSA